MKHPKLHVGLEDTEATAVGGLAIAAGLVKSLELPKAINAAVDVLKDHRPYTEADHLLAHVYNLYLGGTSIEDVAYLRSEPVMRMLGASRVPDPTTAGDFLRRFDETTLRAFESVIDEAHERTWRRAYGSKKRDVALLDIDSHVHHIYGEKKENADFTYKGSYGYHPFVMSLAGTQEVLRIHNRPGNVSSADGVAAELEKVMPLLTKHFRKVIVRGDSAFAHQDIFDVCHEFDQYFAIVCPQHRNLARIADCVEDAEWKPFSGLSKTNSRNKQCRKRGKNLRRAKARNRGMRDIKLQKQWLAEVPYEPTRGKRKENRDEYRLIIRRQKIEESNQGQLFTFYRYRFVLTNLPETYTTEEVTRMTYRRCDQENIIEQLQHGVSAMRMPSGSFVANAMFLLCARLAFNLKAWLGMLALPLEVMRWEWKRFRYAFVYLSARVVLKARQVIVRFAQAHRFAPDACAGIVKLQS